MKLLGTIDKKGVIKLRYDTKLNVGQTQTHGHTRAEAEPGVYEE